MQQLTHLNNTSSIRNKNSDNRYRTRYRDYNKMIVILYVYGKRTSFFFSFSICLSICIELHVCISVML